MPSASYWDPWQVSGSNPSKGEYLYVNLSENQLGALMYAIESIFMILIQSFLTDWIVELGAGV